MDFLPKIKMDFIPNEESDNENIEENVIVESEELECDILGKEELIAEPTKKSESMDSSEIFESISEINKETKVRDPKLTKSGKPRKKRPPMSAEHKEKLKIAREKALEVRRANSKAKKEDKELIKKEKQLLRKQKEQTVQKLEKDTNDYSDSKPAPQKKEINIEEAVLNGITQYEIIRKQRKKEKNENNKKLQESQQIKDQLSRAIAPKKPNNPFYNCY